MRVRSLGGEDPQEEDMASHSSVPAWRIPRTEEPGGLQPTGWPRAGQDRDPHTHSPGSPASSDQETPPREHSTLSRNSLSSETSTSFTYLLQILIHCYEMLLVLYYLVTNKHQLPTMR